MATKQIQSVQQAFEQFEPDVVRVPKEENDAAKEVHPQIRDTIAQNLPEHLETFLSGSYSRRVQVVKLKDVDIIVVLDDPDGQFTDSADAALEALRKAAATSELVKRTLKRRRSVRLTLHDHEFTIDLVAALEPPDGEDGLLLARHIPEEGLDDWTFGHPRGQRQAAIDKNEECGGIYIPSVRPGEVLARHGLGRRPQAVPQLPRRGGAARRAEREGRLPRGQGRVLRRRLPGTGARHHHPRPGRS
jgi:hypothetical protein